MSAESAADSSRSIEQLVSVLGSSHLNFWREVVDVMNEGLLLVSPDRRILYLNRKAEELIGTTQAEAQGRECADAINCPQCRCRCRLYEEGDFEGIEVKVFGGRDQKKRTFLKNARLLRDQDGNIVGGVETFKDISREVEQRKDNERYTSMIFAEKTRTEALLASLREGVFTIDSEFRIQSFSPRMAELCGLSEEEARDQNFFELLGLEKPFASVEKLSDLHARTCRVELRREDGSALPVELAFRPIRFSDGEVLGVVRALDEQSTASACRTEDTHFHGIVSRSVKMREIFQLLESAANSRANILLEGESGTGKELLAQAIHRLGPQRSEPFHAVNCATFTGSLLLSELFGHERGAFTGAYRSTPGKLEMAGAGTLFLDEVSQIPLHYQGVLLRVLEERSFERVGGQRKTELKARIIAATNERLTEAVHQGRFREDLYYRLKVIPILVPPLRERPEDIPLLADYFAQHPAINLTGHPVRISPEALRVLTEHRWPGNVRELRNLIEYLCFVAQDEIDVSHLPAEIRAEAGPASLTIPVDTDERARLKSALAQTNFHRGRAARLLGINRTTLWRKMKQFGIG